MPSPRLLACIFLPLAACGSGGPYSTNLSVKRTTTGNAVTTAYQITDGGDPVERAGTIGSGENCVVATQSSGTRTSLRTFELQEHFNVVGDSEAELPLIPGEDEVSKVWASVLRERTRASSSIETTENFVDITAEPAQWQTREYTDEAQTTSAGYHAVAADEFYVRMDLGDLWEDLEELESSDVELLTMANPGKGDIWPSQNGNSLFIWEAQEKISLAGVEGTLKADRIAVYTTGSVSPEGEDTAVYDQCFNFGLAQVDDSRPDVEAVDSETMLIDPGCVGEFEHVRRGTQWWYDGVLVKETSTVTYVTINEYGYQWTEEDETTGACTRVTSTSRDEPTGIPFVQYDVTVSTVETVATSLLD